MVFFFFDRREIEIGLDGFFWDGIFWRGWMDGWIDGGINGWMGEC